MTGANSNYELQRANHGKDEACKQDASTVDLGRFGIHYEGCYEHTDMTFPSVSPSNFDHCRKQACEGNQAGAWFGLTNPQDALYPGQATCVRAKTGGRAYPGVPADRPMCKQRFDKHGHALGGPAKVAIYLCPQTTSSTATPTATPTASPTATPTASPVAAVATPTEAPSYYPCGRLGKLSHYGTYSFEIGCDCEVDSQCKFGFCEPTGGSTSRVCKDPTLAPTSTPTATPTTAPIGGPCNAADIPWFKSWCDQYERLFCIAGHPKYNEARTKCPASCCTTTE